MISGLRSAWPVFVLCIVTTPAFAVGADDYDPDNPVDLFVFKVFEDKPLAGEMAGTSLDRLEKALGKPESVKQKTGDFRNRKSEVEYQFTIHTLVYPGMTVRASQIKSSPAGIYSIRITSSDYKLVGGLHLGMPIAAFQKFLGEDNLKPVGTGGRDYVVHDDCLFTDESGGTELAFDVKLKTDKAGRVISLTWASAQPEGY